MQGDLRAKDERDGAERDADKWEFLKKQGVPPESGVTICASLFIILI